MRRATARIVRAGWAALLASCVAGCAEPPSLLKGVELLRTMPAEAPIRAVDAALTTPGRSIWDVTEGQDDDEPARVVITVEPTQEHGAAGKSSESGGRAEFHRVDTDGNVVLIASIEPRDEALTLFDPPLILLYAKLDPGEERVQEFSMRVLDRRDPTRQREAGRGTRRVHYVDDCVVGATGGPITAARLEIRLDATLRLARVHTESTWLIAHPEQEAATGPWRSEGLGLIARQESERVSILGAFPRDRRRTLMLAVPNAPPGKP